jgi:hypothetical protein
MTCSKFVSSKIQLTMKTSLFRQLRQIKLAGRFARLTMSDPTQISQPTNFDSNSGFASEMESYPGSFCDRPSPFLLGLHNMALVH